MLTSFKEVWNHFFYNPYSFVKKNKNIMIGKKTALEKTATFHIQQANKIIIGKDSLIACNFIFESDQGSIEIGDRTHINGGTNLISRTGIKIGDDVTIAWGCYIYDHNSHSLDWRERSKDTLQQLDNFWAGRDLISKKNWDCVKSEPIVIKDKVWIGMNCVIMRGVTIGEGAVVGACSTVRKDVPAWTVVAGNPAQVIKKLNKN